MNSFLIVVAFLCSWAWAQGPNVNFTLKAELTAKPLSKIEFGVPPDHHFNFKAPNSVEILSDKKWVPAEKIEGEGRSLTATWKSPLDPCAGLRAKLFVCDDKNTYCVPLSRSFGCDQKTSQGEPWVSEPEKKSQESIDALFIVNDAEKALKLAHEGHKLLLVDFFGIWCPPCNELDELVFRSSEFQSLQDKFVFLKLDADSSQSWSLKAKYHVTGYPTVVLASEDGDEIKRILGYRPKKEFVSLMNEALKSRDQTVEALKDASEKSDGAAFKLGLIYLDRENFSLAHYYLLKASRHWGLPDVRRNKLMSAQLGLHAKGTTTPEKEVYKKLLLHALEWYPRAPEVFQRTDELYDVAGDLKDKESQKKAKQVQAETAKWFLVHPKALYGTDFSKGDLFEVLGLAYEDLDEKQKALDAFAAGAQEYLKELHQAGLNENTERGFNLERIYCLWKSGQVDQAQSLYEKFEKQYPDEFTYYFQHARLLKELKQYDEGVKKAQKAWSLSYGDNRLRVTALLAELLNSANQKKGALDLLQDTIKTAKTPDDTTIRTYRYLDKLKTLEKKIRET